VTNRWHIVIGNSHIGLYVDPVSGKVGIGHPKNNDEGIMEIAVMDLNGTDHNMNGTCKEYNPFAWFGREGYVIHVYVKTFE
jgi:hypothetical protein